MTFAFVAWALNNLSQWMAMRTPADKAAIVQPSVGLAYDEANEPHKLMGIKLGIIAKSTAQFPIEINLEQLDTRVMDRIPSIPTEQIYPRSIKVAPEGVAQLTSAIIDVSQLPSTSNTLLSKVEAKISYGRPGKFEVR